MESTSRPVEPRLPSGEHIFFIISFRDFDGKLKKPRGERRDLKASLHRVRHEF